MLSKFCEPSLILSQQLTQVTMFVSFFRVSVLAFFSFVLTACGGGETNVERGNRLGILHFSNAGEPQGLDPVFVKANVLCLEVSVDNVLGV